MRLVAVERRRARRSPRAGSSTTSVTRRHDAAHAHVHPRPRLHAADDPRRRAALPRRLPDRVAARAGRSGGRGRSPTPQGKVFEAAMQFAVAEGKIPAPETAHAIRGAIEREALAAKETGEEKVILFNYKRPRSPRPGGLRRLPERAASSTPDPATPPSGRRGGWETAGEVAARAVPSPPMFVKICGITNEDDALLRRRHGRRRGRLHVRPVAAPDRAAAGLRHHPAAAAGDPDRRRVPRRAPRSG